MKRLSNANAQTLGGAVELARAARRAGVRAAYAGGGSDLLGMVKERITEPDVVVSLRTVAGHDEVEATDDGVRIGGLITLDALSRDALIQARFAVLAEAAGTVATPQIRNVGTLAGNLSQRPWCWYYRNGFDCYKAGGNQCFSATGENQFHAIFGGGPSYIVHPSDTAVALVALEATFRLVGPSEERVVPAAEFFALPSADPARENVLREDELLAGVEIQAPATVALSAYHKVMDRESWTHAVVSAAVVMELEGDVCRRARIVLGGVAPTPWRVPAAEQVLVGARVTPALAARAGEMAVEGARPLSKNAYKVPLTSGVVERTVLELVHRADQ
ncbi:MAG: FAD binding domain-containing protein [Vicinamibacterales bacterium]|nr:FAD binding domain-containing protein [Vicinamibacterales bacterium]